MKTTISLSILFLLILPLDAFPISKVYTGKPILTKKIVDGIQYVNKGESYTDSEEAPIVIIVDEENNTIKITCPSYDHPDSLCYKFIPGDLISIRFSAGVSRDDESNYYTYNYSVQSENNSRTLIDRINVDQLYEYKDVISAHGWIGGFNRNYKTQSWSQHRQSGLLMPGTAVSGFGYVSENPPVLGNFFISGEIKHIKWPDTDILEHVFSELIEEHKGVSGITIIPGPKPEKIHGPPWIMQITNGLGKLASHGYTGDSFMDVHRTLIKLYQDLNELNKPSFDIWNHQINNALNQLAPYESNIEPEAWSYITENLKYMQRNKDIVWFGK